jgi:hypothetical protein
MPFERRPLASGYAFFLYFVNFWLLTYVKIIVDGAEKFNGWSLEAF